METKEDREKRLAELMGTKIDGDWIGSGRSWTTLIDDIAKNCNPEDIKKPNFMKRHKHSSRLNKLYQRIAMWKQVGPSVSETEWDVMIAALRMVEVLMNKCSVDVDYKITAKEMKQLNHYYRLYKIGK